mmetsp:Transcript_68372/g.130138  ORF Transcript_68372/g.130138 Transcript_68372/m.130138 type:complete len:238 (-) Transcript_68372:54-767(-)
MLIHPYVGLSLIYTLCKSISGSPDQLLHQLIGMLVSMIAHSKCRRQTQLFRLMMICLHDSYPWLIQMTMTMLAEFLKKPKVIWTGQYIYSSMVGLCPHQRLPQHMNYRGLSSKLLLMLAPHPVLRPSCHPWGVRAIQIHVQGHAVFLRVLKSFPKAVTKASRVRIAISLVEVTSAPSPGGVSACACVGMVQRTRNAPSSGCKRIACCCIAEFMRGHSWLRIAFRVRQACVGMCNFCF